jgi:hypothetical protein
MARLGITELQQVRSPATDISARQVLPRSTASWNFVEVEATAPNADMQRL